MMRVILLVMMISIPRSRQAEIPAEKFIGMYGPTVDTNTKANISPAINDVDPKVIASIFEPLTNTANGNEATTTNNYDQKKINGLFKIPVTANNGPTNNCLDSFDLQLEAVDVAAIMGQGPTPATTPANNNLGNNVFDLERMKKIFGITGGPSNNNPTVAPTLNPTVMPTLNPTVTPTLNPTVAPTLNPTVVAMLTPTVAPILNPSDPCQCVTYNLCNHQKEGNKVYDPSLTGFTVIDMRFNIDYCEDSMDVCCKIPKLPTAATTQRPPAKKPKGCGYRNPNGIEVFVTNTAASTSQFGEFPWVVALLDTRNNSYIGAGVIIHPQVVLTAAHVVSKYASDVIKIRAGEWDTKTVREPFPHEERQVQMIHTHPGNFNERNDVAMLHLERPLELTEHINTICLPDQGEVLDTAKNCIANGWGKDRFGTDAPFAVILKKLELDMVDHGLCNTLLSYTRLGSRYILHNSLICAGGEEGKDMCSGDGGGPLACPIGNDRYKLAGLVVGGIGCGKKGIPGLYLSLPATRSWVDERMNTLGFGTSAYTI